MSWNDLTDRQKQLDRLIDGCGIKLNSTNSCVEKVARAIGATSSELDFVQQRIELRQRTAELLDKTDAFISNAVDPYARSLEQEITVKLFAFGLLNLVFIYATLKKPFIKHPVQL